MDPPWDCKEDLEDITRDVMKEEGPKNSSMRSNTCLRLSVHCYKSLGGKEGFRAWISPNCQNNLEIRLDMFLTSLGGGLVLQRRVQEGPGRDTE